MFRKSPDPGSKRHKQNIRKRGQKRRIRWLQWHRNGWGRCHWCDQPIISVASIPAELRVSVSGTYVHWRTDEGVVRALVATTDHVVAVADGGKNGRNIVTSCAPCNQARKSQKALDAEAAEAARKRAERVVIRWLVRVGARVSFGDVCRIEIERDGEVVVKTEHKSFESAYSNARQAYSRWHFSQFGRTAGQKPQQAPDDSVGYPADGA